MTVLPLSFWFVDRGRFTVVPVLQATAQCGLNFENLYTDKSSGLLIEHIINMIVIWPNGLVYDSQAVR